MAVGGLDTVFGIMREWMDSMPNVESISVALADDLGMRIQVLWKDRMMYTYHIPKLVLETGNLAEYGKMILSEAEK